MCLGFIDVVFRYSLGRETARGTPKTLSLRVRAFYIGIPTAAGLLNEPRE